MCESSCIPGLVKRHFPSGRIQNMDRGPWPTPDGPGPWTTPWTRFMDPVHGPSPWTTPWTTPNSQKEIAPVHMKIYRRSGYEKHVLIFIAYVLEGLSRNIIAGCFESKALERVMLSGNLPPPRSCFV